MKHALLCLVLASLWGQPSQASVPSDAVDLALADAERFHPYERTKLRYIWMSGPMNEELTNDKRSVFFSINAISRMPVLYVPGVVGGSRTFLVRIDTRRLVPEDEWLDFIQHWEDFRFDPSFNAFITQGQVNLVKEFSHEVLAGTQKRWILANSQTAATKGKKPRSSIQLRILEIESAARALKRDGVVRVRPIHLSHRWERLAGMLETEAPVIDYRYFMLRILTSIQDKDNRKVFNTVFGGRYYELAGIPDTFDKLLGQLGAFGDGKKKNATQILEDVRSDQRLAMWRSKVTGKQRRISVFKTRAGREHQGLALLTSDFGDADFDVDQSPLANLLDLRNIKAHEFIFEKTNGFHGFALYDGQFKRQDSVPEDVAKDHTTPFPHSGRLQSGISCIRCHGTNGNDGWIPAPNDVLSAFKTGRFDIAGDFGRRDQNDALQRIVGLYMGSVDIALDRGRKDYARAVLTATGPWKGSKDNTDVVAYASARVGRIFKEYWYDTVSARTALQDMGIFAGKGEAALQFHRSIAVVGPYFSVEPAAVASLRAGLEINRADWALVQGYVMLAYKGK